MEVFRDTATECHLPYGITQCYLLPDTSEHTPKFWLCHEFMILSKLILAIDSVGCWKL